VQRLRLKRDPPDATHVHALMEPFDQGSYATLLGNCHGSPRTWLGPISSMSKGTSPVSVQHLQPYKAVCRIFCRTLCTRVLVRQRVAHTDGLTLKRPFKCTSSKKTSLLLISVCALASPNAPLNRIGVVRRVGPGGEILMHAQDGL
jgi:hypothetical protein